MYSNLNKIWYSIYFTCIPIVWGIIYIIVSSFTSYFVYNNKILSKFPFLKFLISLNFYFCAFMTLFCHIKSMLTNPGIIIDNMVNRLKKNEKTFCKKCNKFRPLRAHHCSTCGKCILKMDHHCPWIFNCVGYYNQKTFFFFFFYATLCDLIASPCLIINIFTKKFLYLLLRPIQIIDMESDNVTWKIIKEIKEPLWIIISSCLAISITISVGGLLLNQIICIMKNITNVEYTIYESDEYCPYYAYKDKFIMFKSVLGLKEKWKWFFPIFEENKFNGGYTFDTPYKRIVKEKKKNEEKDDMNKWFCCC